MGTTREEIDEAERRLRAIEDKIDRLAAERVGLDQQAAELENEFKTENANLLDLYRASRKRRNTVGGQ